MARQRTFGWLPSVWGGKAVQGALVWESGQPWLYTPDGRVLLAVPATVELPVVEPLPTASPVGEPMPRAEVMVVGKRLHRDGQLVMVVRNLMALGHPR